MENEVLTGLSLLTGDEDLLPVKTTVTEETVYGIQERSVYYMAEEDLPLNLQELLHGRAFVVDREVVSATDISSAVTYYIAADKGKGLIVPARSMSIDCINSDAHYRWTDDGDRWTDWITIPNGAVDSYTPDEQNRFAEVQAYCDTAGLISVRASR